MNHGMALDQQIWIAPPTLTALEIVLGHRLGEKRSCDHVLLFIESSAALFHFPNSAR